ncbi:MAG: hypothetical protein GWO20_06515 [Candidatus Korarchaeota archaeon]|nr:hypothetical protein [Candidatus Korarchaeota archaeon]NIU83098.1 hypothetical protein [Candidatus Thorarchaeota archaeon]NIW13476.1 hypothetical protein [Candidatus Thorarchaeota archaeon]
MKIAFLVPPYQQRGTNVAEPVERAKTLEEIGGDILCIHVGIDQQMEGMKPLSILEDRIKRGKTLSELEDLYKWEKVK